MDISSLHQFFEALNSSNDEGSILDFKSSFTDNQARLQQSLILQEKDYREILESESFKSTLSSLLKRFDITLPLTTWNIVVEKEGRAAIQSPMVPISANPFFAGYMVNMRVHRVWNPSKEIRKYLQDLDIINLDKASSGDEEKQQDYFRKSYRDTYAFYTYIKPIHCKHSIIDLEVTDGYPLRDRKSTDSAEIIGTYNSFLRDGFEAYDVGEYL